MAEAVGLAASVVALAGLAHTVLKFVNEAHTIVKGMGKFGQETAKSMRYMHIAADTIDIARRTLSKYCAIGGVASQSEVVHFIEGYQTTKFLELESENLGQHVDRLREGVHALEKRWAPVATMLWRYFIKEQVEDLREDMQFIEYCLSVLLSCVQLEVAVHRHSRDEAEIAYHKRIIKQKEKEIKRLRKNRVSASAGLEGTDQRYSTVSGQQLGVKVQLNIILKLAETVRKAEKVPQSAQTTPSSSRSRGPSSSTSGTRRTAEIRTYEDEQSMLQPEPPVLPRLPSVSSLHVLPSRSEVSSETHSRARSFPNAPTSSAVSRSGSGAGRSQALTITRSPSIHSDDDFIGVHSGEAFMIVTSETRIEQGHFRYRDRDKVAAVVKIRPEQAFNFMTAIRASELGLLDFVQPHEDDDDDEETWIVLPSGKRIRPDGTIQLRWYPRQSRSITLQLFVLSGWWETEIVLGAPYVAKEEYYARRGRDGKE